MSNISNNIFNIIIFNKFEQKIFILPTQHTKSLKTNVIKRWWLGRKQCLCMTKLSDEFQIF